MSEAVPWSRFTAEALEYASFVQQRFEAHGLGLLATLRADGSPRISGIEPAFGGGQLWLGMMPGSLKAADLRRDGRFALHSATVDKQVTDGDVKVNGYAVPVTDDEGFAEFSAAVGERRQPGSAELFWAALTLVSSVRVGGDHLVIESWRPGEPVTTRQRF